MQSDNFIRCSKCQEDDATHARNVTESDLAACEDPNECPKLPDVLGHKVFGHNRHWHHPHSFFGFYYHYLYRRHHVVVAVVVVIGAAALSKRCWQLEWPTAVHLVWCGDVRSVLAGPRRARQGRDKSHLSTSTMTTTRRTTTIFYCESDDDDDALPRRQCT